MVGRRGVLDVVRAGRRIARSDVPGLTGPLGEVVGLDAYASPDPGGQVGIDIRFTLEGSARLVRHYYGYLLHADVPWTLGKFELVFNSPAMHRWHHSRDVRTSSTNFATIFSVWDRVFGTLHAPGPCDAPLGVEEDMGQGVVGQYLHPFRVWLGLNRPQEPSVPAPAPVRIQVEVAAAKAITPAV